MKRNIVLTGGGTGGHIYPALAIARGLHDRYGDDVSLHYIGSGRGLEKRLVTDPFIQFHEIRAAGFSGRGPAGKLKGLTATVRGFVQTLVLLRTIRPRLIVGTGGYVTVPVLLAGWVRRLPVVIHEQNAYPGLANRLAGRFAREIFLTFEDSHRYFRPDAPARLTGLPVRPGFLETVRDEPGKKPEDGRRTLLVTGGSQGARVLNDVILDSLTGLVSRGWKIHLITGTGDAQRVTDRLAQMDRADLPNDSLLVQAYCEQMDLAMNRADLVVGRSGASFLAELGILGKPSVLVPYPHAAADHQRHNAKALEQAGAARMISQEVLSSRVFLDVLDSLDEQTLAQMARASGRLGKREALDLILEGMRKHVE